MNVCDLPTPERSLRALQQAELIGIYFLECARTLIIDFRPDISGAPRVVVEEAAPSPRELLTLIRRHHGPAAAIAQFTYVSWRNTRQEFARCGLLQMAINRLTALGEEQSATMVMSAWQEIMAA